MKKQIAEVQKYFTDKITACQFNVTEIKDTNDGWFTLNVEIDGFNFSFSIDQKREICTNAYGLMDIEIPNDRLKNIIELVNSTAEKIKAEKIEKLKAELAKLESKAEVEY